MIADFGLSEIISPEDVATPNNQEKFTADVRFLLRLIGDLMACFHSNIRASLSPEAREVCAAFDARETDCPKSVDDLIEKFLWFSMAQNGSVKTTHPVNSLLETKDYHRIGYQPPEGTTVDSCSSGPSGHPRIKIPELSHPGISDTPIPVDMIEIYQFAMDKASKFCSGDAIFPHGSEVRLEELDFNSKKTTVYTECLVTYFSSMSTFFGWQSKLDAHEIVVAMLELSQENHSRLMLIQSDDGTELRNAKKNMKRVKGSLDARLTLQEKTGFPTAVEKLIQKHEDVVATEKRLFQNMRT